MQLRTFADQRTEKDRGHDGRIRGRPGRVHRPTTAPGSRRPTRTCFVHRSTSVPSAPCLQMASAKQVSERSGAAVACPEPLPQRLRYQRVDQRGVLLGFSLSLPAGDDGNQRVGGAGCVLHRRRRPTRGTRHRWRARRRHGRRRRMVPGRTAREMPSYDRRRRFRHPRRSHSGKRRIERRLLEQRVAPCKREDPDPRARATARAGFHSLTPAPIAIGAICTSASSARQPPCQKRKPYAGFRGFPAAVRQRSHHGHRGCRRDQARRPRPSSNERITRRTVVVVEAHLRRFDEEHAIHFVLRARREHA